MSEDLAKALAKAALAKKKGSPASKYSDLGKELLEALEGKDHEAIGRLFRDQVDIAVADVMKGKDAD